MRALYKNVGCRWPGSLKFLIEKAHVCHYIYGVVRSRVPQFLSSFLIYIVCKDFVYWCLGFRKETCEMKINSCVIPNSLEDLGRFLAICPGTLRNLINRLHWNPPEPHQPSAPEPSGTSAAFCTGTLRNLILYCRSFLGSARSGLCVCESIVWLRNRAPQFLNLVLPLLPWLCPFWLVCV